MTKHIDFTTMRLGYRTRGTRRIERCPKCGRKGECSRLEIVKGRRFRNFTHKADNTGFFVMVRESCSVDGWSA